MSAANEKLIVVENEEIRVAFAAETGELTSLFATPHSREYLAGKHEGPFAVWHGFAAPYRFLAEKEGGACNRPPDPKEIADGCFLPGQLAEADVEDARAVLTYRDSASSLAAKVTVELDGSESRWSLTVVNEGTEPVEMMADFPRWEGIGLSREAGGQMLAMNQAGYVGTIWHYPGGLYGHSFQQSAQFGCLFEKETGDCFGFYIEDPTFGAKEIRFNEPDVVIRWFPPLQLEAGESHTYPASTLLLYDGSWKKTAKAYGGWFERTVRPDPVPEWVRLNESYTGAWAEKRGDEYETHPGPSTDDMPPGAMETFDELPVHFLRRPSETIEFAFYCRQSQQPATGDDGEPLGPQPRRHTDGWNDIREDLGGMPALARGVEAVHGMGRRVTLYVEGLIVPDDSELFDHIPAARDWVVVNADGTTNGPYDNQRFVHMCPGCVEWQDHVVDMCVRLARESGVDGIRLDSLGFYYWPCHNPAHKHASPFDYNLWVQALYAKVAHAVREIIPDALLSTEAPADFNHRHFNHSLHQISQMELPEAISEGVSPLRIALPGYRLHTGSTIAGPSMQLQPLWLTPEKEDAPWLAAFAAARPTICDGEVALVDPESSPEGMLVRRVSSKTEDVVTGVRPDWIDDPDTPYRLPFEADRTKTTVTVPLGYQPAEAWLFDLQVGTLSLLTWDDSNGAVSFTTDSSWFMALFRREKGPNPCWIDMPAEVGRDRNVTLNISSPGTPNPVEAILRIPGMADGMTMTVNVPGKIDLHIPSETPPAWYRAEISGQDLCPSVKLFRVTKG